MPSYDWKGNFDTHTPRRNTDSIKWDLHPDLIPFWIADMDFPSPPCILDALRARVEHGVFGYSYPPADMKQVVIEHLRSHHQITPNPHHLLHIGGCVPGLVLAVKATASPGDDVMTCTPVYPPIRQVHIHGECNLIEVPHIRTDGDWTFDWAAMEAAVTPRTRLFILCNPQNPLGRVFSAQEILRLADFCARHNIVLCSDEIHCDLVLEDSLRHYSALHLPEEYQNNFIMLSAPSKTYNIAGLGYTYAIITNEPLRTRFLDKMRHSPEINCFAYTAARAAFLHGEPWRQAMLAHLRRNRDILLDFMRVRLPQVKIPHIQATYLAWMDFSAISLPCPINEFLTQNAGVELNDGLLFGEGNCVRFNFGTSTELMLQGLSQIEQAVISFPRNK